MELECSNFVENIYFSNFEIPVKLKKSLKKISKKNYGNLKIQIFRIILIIRNQEKSTEFYENLFKKKGKWIVCPLVGWMENGAR